MAEIGKFNTLEILRETENGVYLDGGEHGEILMPRKYVEDEMKERGTAEVFVYTDSEDRLVATTEKPLATVGEFACLTVKATAKFGAFLDWGLAKDLLVPFSEQRSKMQEGNSYWVYVYLDLLTNRVVASAKLHKFLDNTPPEYTKGQEVSLIILEETDLGYKAIVNQEHTGMLYKNQVFRKLEIGRQTKGYIAKIRNDEKIDLILEEPGYEKVDAISAKILTELEASGGFMAVSDKSSPEIIKAMFGISKKNFKKAIGGLYKKRLITFVSDGIKMLKS
ncbi:S1-like domain-containing RNA-binding protein [Draconibacterium orientale]|jgi:predicted RNA-binding protein (virulence factor B family)|uniref:CvfB family protein n=1 Tax=Draconibacterium orientale TaxID=1168034 RepID=UPI002A0A1F59|nr:S1-like domain-containing RNA-binding protein [Draconibacterium orientale]